MFTVGLFLKINIPCIQSVVVTKFIFPSILGTIKDKFDFWFIIYLNKRLIVNTDECQVP